MGFIYCITNKLNLKRYIGQTIEKNIQTRWTGHFKKGSNCRYLKHALIKYGKANFNFEVVLTCEDTDLDRHEAEYMEKYNTLVPNGYNLRAAGNHGSHNEETKRKIGETVKEYYSKLSPDQRKELYGQRVGEKNHNFGKKMPDHVKEKISTTMKKRPVACYTLTHEFITNFKSASEAVRVLKFRSSANISHCCRGRCKTAYGFIWKFI